MTLRAIIRPKAGTEPPTLDPKVAATIVLRHRHAAKCKEKLDDCELCQDNVKWFATLPLNVLNVALSEAPIRVRRRSK